MLCDKCNKRESIVRITVLTDGKSKMLSLCEKCLEQQGIDSLIINNIASIYGGIILDLLSKYLSFKVNNDDFLKDGEICSWEIDEEFHQEFNQYENQSNNNNFHAEINEENKSSRVEISTHNLQKRLDQAIEEENYELAAKLRDKIIELKRENDF